VDLPYICTNCSTTIW